MGLGGPPLRSGFPTLVYRGRFMHQGNNGKLYDRDKTGERLKEIFGAIRRDYRLRAGMLLGNANRQLRRKNPRPDDAAAAVEREGPDHLRGEERGGATTAFISREGISQEANARSRKKKKMANSGVAGPQPSYRARRRGWKRGYPPRKAAPTPRPTAGKPAEKQPCTGARARPEQLVSAGREEKKHFEKKKEKKRPTNAGPLQSHSR